MTKQTDLGGSFTLTGTSLSLTRMGYGAMRLTGPQVWGPPRDVDAAIAVLREAVAAGLPTDRLKDKSLSSLTGSQEFRKLIDMPSRLSRTN